MQLPQSIIFFDWRFVEIYTLEVRSYLRTAKFDKLVSSRKNQRVVHQSKCLEMTLTICRLHVWSSRDPTADTLFVDDIMIVHEGVNFVCSESKAAHVSAEVLYVRVNLGRELASRRQNQNRWSLSRLDLHSRINTTFSCDHLETTVWSHNLMIDDEWIYLRYVNLFLTKPRRFWKRILKIAELR